MKIFIKNLFIYEYNHIFAVSVMNKYIRDMANMNRRYVVGACGTGWCLWDTMEGIKVQGFTSCAIGRFYALKYMYILYGWDWSKSKYVRENPSLANLHWGDLF